MHSNFNASVADVSERMPTADCQEEWTTRGSGVVDRRGGGGGGAMEFRGGAAVSLVRFCIQNQE